jgi:hypothetical protein
MRSGRRTSSASSTVRARPGRLSSLSVSHRKSFLCGAFVHVWARRGLNRQKRRFAARAVTANPGDVIIMPLRLNHAVPPRPRPRTCFWAQGKCKDFWISGFLAPDVIDTQIKPVTLSDQVLLWGDKMLIKIMYRICPRLYLLKYYYVLTIRRTMRPDPDGRQRGSGGSLGA